MGDHHRITMAKVFLLLTFLVASIAAQSNNDTNVDHVLKPLPGKAGAPKMFVFIPGANVNTEYYLATAAAIQQASDLNMWVVIPSMPIKRCIILCPSLSVCAPLQDHVTAIIAKATAQGYNGTASAPDTFIAGHSLGGICAQRLGQAYLKPPYQATIVMGSYAEATSGAGSTQEYPTPLLTVGAELDGGLGRPAMIGVRLKGSDSAAAKYSAGNSTVFQLTKKPVVILPGLDHSSFCPGFKVPGDVFPAEASEQAALSAASETIGAFLSLNSAGASEASSEAALQLLADKLVWTRKLLAPLEAAYVWESGNNDGNFSFAPMCTVGQKMLAGDKAQDKVDIDLNVYKQDSHEFEHTRTTYAAEAGGRLALNVSGHNDYYSGISTGCLVPAEDVGCKMTSSDQIAKQLKLTDNSSPDCSDVNKWALQQALDILGKSEVGKATLARFKAKGRGIFFADDFAPFENIGPLFVKGHIKIADSSKGITISSIAIKNSLSSAIFPGVHYCKFVSPARLIDYMMIDSLKPASGCLNA